MQERPDHQGRLRLGQPGGVLESVRVVGTGKGLLGHPESESSRRRSFGHIELSGQRKLGEQKTFLEGRGQTLPGQLGAARRGGAVCTAGERRARTGSGGAAARGGRGRTARLVGAPSGCRFPPAPGAAAGPARRRHGGAHPGADGATAPPRTSGRLEAGAAAAHRAL